MTKLIRYNKKYNKVKQKLLHQDWIRNITEGREPQEQVQESETLLCTY